MKLVDLDPRWVTDSPRRADGSWNGHHNAGRRVGVSFLCPHCWHVCEPFVPRRIAVAFANPTDGGPPSASFERHWQRTGETFEALTLTPSVDASNDGHWHGFITNGEIT